jgi:Ca-activated chloride channel family protein
MRRVEKMRRATVAVLAAALALSPRALGQVSEQAQEAFANAGKDVALRFVAPRKDDLPIGPTVIDVEVEGGRPGDRVEIFADGRKVGQATERPWRATWDAGPAPREHSLQAVLFRAGVEAASARMSTRRTGVISSVNRHAVNIFPIVTDRSGRYVWNLSREDFVVLEDGHLQSIDTFDEIGSTLMVAVVLDVSESMLPKLASAKSAARQFVDALEPEDEAGLLMFNSRVTGWTPFSKKKDALRKNLLGATAEGETALYDATASALMKVRAATGRRALVIFTDGEDNKSRLSIDQVVEMAQTSESSIFTVAEGVEESKALRGHLGRLARETGGRAFFISSIESLKHAFEGILADLKNQYFLTYTPPEHPKRTWHRIEVSVKRPGLKVRAKTGYFTD